MKLKNKFLFILALFVFFILLNCKPIFAYSFSQENYVVTTYNNEWIESYLDLGMNPSDGIKNVLIDKNQDYFTFTSSELGDCWVCEKVTSEDGSYYYLFLFCPGQIALRYHYGDFCEYYYVTENLDSSEYKCFFILFAENGFYSNKSYELTDSCWLYYPETIYNHEFIVSNCDILDYSNGAPEGSVLFTEPETKNGTTLAPVIQREKTKGTLQGVLKEIILILPLILVVVVSLVGLRKALKMLFAVLRRS